MSPIPHRTPNVHARSAVYPPSPSIHTEHAHPIYTLPTHHFSHPHNHTYTFWTPSHNPKIHDCMYPSSLASLPAPSTTPHIVPSLARPTLRGAELNAGVDQPVRLARTHARSTSEPVSQSDEQARRADGRALRR